MKHFESFRVTGVNYSDRLGEPEEWHAALGQAVINFGCLESSVRSMVTLLVGMDEAQADSLTSERPLDEVVALLAALVGSAIREGRYTPSDGVGSFELWFEQLASLLRETGSLERELTRSVRDGSLRRMLGTLGNRTIRVPAEGPDAGVLLDMADFFAYATEAVEALPLRLGIADGMGSEGDTVNYSRDGRVVLMLLSRLE